MTPLGRRNALIAGSFAVTVGRSRPTLRRSSRDRGETWEARVLLVSHWAVSSEATVSLINHIVGAISRAKKLGRAEALRRAMLATIDTVRLPAHHSR